jgi:hypothetical protein
MADVLVRRDQFNITPEGIVHKPTDAAFTANPGDPYSGITRLGQLGSKHPNNGKGFRPDDVQRMMWELWTEYVTGAPQLFSAAKLRRANPGATGSDWPDTNTN